MLVSASRLRGIEDRLLLLGSKQAELDTKLGAVLLVAARSEQRIIELIRVLREGLTNMTSAVDEKINVLIEELRGLTDAVDSMMLLFDETTQAALDTKDDPEQLEAVINGMRANRERIRQAMVARTSLDPQKDAGVTNPPQQQEGTSSAPMSPRKPRDNQR